LQVCSFEEQAHAYKYLANYHLKGNRLEKAYYAAQKCTEFFEVLLLPILKQWIILLYFYCVHFSLTLTHNVCMIYDTTGSKEKVKSTVPLWGVGGVLISLC